MGKGDKPRTKDIARFRSNYDLIDWRQKKTKKRCCTFKGKTIQYY